MSGFNPRCVDCGVTRLVSLMDLYESDPAGLEPASDEAWRLRHERIPNLAGTCDCGGEFAERAPIRCAGCRSTNVVTVLIALVD